MSDWHRVELAQNESLLGLVHTCALSGVGGGGERTTVIPVATHSTLPGTDRKTANDSST